MSPRGKDQNEQMRIAAIENISGSALRVFAEYGYHGTSMKQISRETGLSYGLVYHYFPSKEKLFIHLVEEALDKSLRVVSDALNLPGSAWEKIENLSAVLIKESLTGESSRYFLIMMQALAQGKGITGLREKIAERSEEMYAKLIPVIIQAQNEGKAVEGPPETLAAAYFTFVHGLTILVLDENGMEKKIKPEILLNVLRK